MGKFSVDGPKTALEVGYYAGLGVKNSQGFGMFEAEGRGLRDMMG
jgi:CRISPR-associated endoribonuclease Cas6